MWPFTKNKVREDINSLGSQEAQPFNFAPVLRLDVEILEDQMRLVANYNNQNLDHPQILEMTLDYLEKFLHDFRIRQRENISKEKHL